MLVIFSILFAYLGDNVEATGSSLCTGERLQECYDLLNKDGLPSVTVLYFSEEVMTEHCRRYRIFSECLNTISPYCTGQNNSSILVYQGINDAYGFVCGDGFQDYKKYQSECFKEPDVQYEAKTCSDIFAARSNYLKQNVTDRKAFRQRYCQYVDDYIDCVYNLLKSFCGFPAANWHKTFDTKTIQPIMESLSCIGWPAAASTTSPANDTGKATIWMISLGSAIVVTGIMVAVGLVLLICARCQCQRRSSRRSISIDMPPPYSGPPFTICRAEDESTTFPAPRSPSITINSELNSRHVDAKLMVPPPEVVSCSSGVENHRSKENGGGKEDAGSSRTVSSIGTVFDDVDEASGAVGGSSPFVRSYTPSGHFEMPSPGSSILSYLQSSDDDTTSLISHTCDYY